MDLVDLAYSPSLKMIIYLVRMIFCGSVDLASC